MVSAPSLQQAFWLGIQVQQTGKRLGSLGGTLEQLIGYGAELGAISYAESISLMDLLLLTGAVDNRRFNEELCLRLTELEKRADKLSLSERG
jgi:hypothetical protein